MPIYTIKDNQTGRTIKVSGNSQPTEADIDSIIANLPRPQKEDSSVAKFGKALVEPAINYGKFGMEAATQGVRAVADPHISFFGRNSRTDEAAAQADEMYKASAALIEQAKREPDPTRRKALLDQSRAIDAQIGVISNEMSQAGSQPETYFVKPSQIATQKDILKTGAKVTAGAAAYAVPGGVGAKGAGMVGRMALGGMASGALSGFAQGDDISPENIARGAGTGLVFGGGLGVAGEAMSRFSPKLGITGRVGNRVEQYGKDKGIASTRISTSGQNLFKKKTGMEIGDYISQNKLYGQNLDRLDEKIIEPLQGKFDTAIMNADQNVPTQEVVNRFNKAIAEFESPDNVLDPTNQIVADYLKAQRDRFVANSPEGVKLTSLVKARQSIDSNTPQIDFVPGESGKMRELGSVYRDIMHNRAGNKDLGRQLNRAYTFKKVLERAPKGKNTQPFGIDAKAAGIVGGMLSQNPIVGATTGFVANKIINSPTTLGLESRAIQGAGRVIKTPNVVSQAVTKTIPTQTGAVTRNAIIQGSTNMMGKPKQKTFKKSGINYPTMDLKGY